MDSESLLEQLEGLQRSVDAQRAEIDRLRATVDAHERTATSSRRAILQRAGLAAAGTLAGGTLLAATAAPAGALTNTFDGNILVRGSSSDATESEIGDGTNALTLLGRAGAVELGSKAGTPILLDAQVRWDSDDDHRGGSHIDINKPAAVLRQTGEDHKGAMIEYQQHLDSGSHERGVATNDPGGRFDVPDAGTKRVAWIVAHYDSPNPVDGVHQHLSIETCKADLETIITRFQVSWGEDVALCSFPNSNVRVIQSDKTLGFGSSSEVRAVYRPDTGKLGFSGRPVEFPLGLLQVDDNWVSPTQFVRKPSPESRSATSVVSNDAHLQVPVAADATYTFTAFILYRAHVDADLRVAFAVPDGATIRWTPGGAAAVGNGIVGPTKSSANGTEPVNVGGAGTGSPMAVAATGILRTEDAGVLRLRWAQDVAHPVATTVERDSFLQLTRVL